MKTTSQFASIYDEIFKKLDIISILCNYLYNQNLILQIKNNILNIL